MSEKTNRSSIGLREIASACNVSLMTVSRAFREKSAIRPETRASILQKAEEMGYFRYPRKGRPATPPISTANQVQLIFGNSGGSMFSFQMCLLTAVEQQLADAGFECIMRTCNGNFARALHSTNCCAFKLLHYSSFSSFLGWSGISTPHLFAQ